MKFKTLLFLIVIALSSCKSVNSYDYKKYSSEINSMLNNWHLKAANADISYFDAIAEKGIYIGTAKEEVWTKSEFLAFSKPYFEKGKAWDFKPYNRNVYFNKEANVAWFNEKLDTWMGVCRGSGVLQKHNGEWKIYQYTLSMAVPNEKVHDVISVIKDEQ